MNKPRLAVLAIAAVLALGGVSMAWNPDYAQPIDEMAKRAGLSAEQIQKIKDIDAAREKTLADLNAAIEAKNQAAKDARDRDDVDKYWEAVDQSRALEKQAQDALQKSNDSRLAVLTAEQKTKLKEANDADRIRKRSDICTQSCQEQAKVCGMSDDQVKSMAAIHVASYSAILQWLVENGEKLDAGNKAMQEARENDDEERAKALGDELKELRAPCLELVRKEGADAFAVLRDDQKAKWLEHGTPEYVATWFDTYNLTDEQKAKIKAVCHTLAQEKGATFESIRAKMEQEMFKSILTDEQKSNRLQEDAVSRLNRKYQDAKLTDDQVARIKEDCIKLIADNGTLATLKDWNSLLDAGDKLAEKLWPHVDAMLSNEQKAAKTAEEKWNHRPKKKAAASQPADR